MKREPRGQNGNTSNGAKPSYPLPSDGRGAGGEGAFWSRFMVPSRVQKHMAPLHEPSLGTSRRQEACPEPAEGAQASRTKGEQSLLTSAATNGGVVQGPNARPESEVEATHEPGFQSAHLTPALSPLKGGEGDCSFAVQRERLFAGCYSA
jgi:hypothetical protein